MWNVKNYQKLALHLIAPFMGVFSWVLRDFNNWNNPREINVFSQTTSHHIRT